MSAITVGTELCGVRIDSVAGHGGSGIVFRATDLATGAPRAVKVLRNADPAALRRLRREADLLAQLDHPQLAPLYGLETHDGQAVLITGWCGGTTLREHEHRPQQTNADVAHAVLRSVAEPLAYLHDRSIVHRDVSPSNVMVAADESLTLIDLGIGHAFDRATLTNDDLLAGTPSYLAPEIVRGESATDRSDQYSLAMMVYEIAAGAPAFPGHGALATTLHHQLHTIPQPLDEIDPELAGPFATAVERALSKDPADRFPSVRDFVAAAEGHETKPDPGRRRWTAIAAVAALLVCTAIVVSITRAPGETDLVATDTDQVLGLIAPSGATETSSSAPVQSEADRDLDEEQVQESGDEQAGQLACNQLAGSDFANGAVPLDYFGDPPGRERVVAQGGVNNSWALEVGVANDFGQYAEVVPVTAGNTYWFQGWFHRQGPVDAAEMGITLLDRNYQSLNLTVIEQVATDAAGYHEVEFANIPADAAYALPYVFKDASPGVLIADELIFGVTATCVAELTAGGD